MGIRAQERRSRVTQAVSYVCCPGPFERGTFMGRGGLVPYLVVLLVAVS